MNPEMTAQIKLRAITGLDLQALTHEQAVLAVLDRAVLWAEHEDALKFTATLKEALMKITLPVFLGVVFMVLKITGAIDWSWWWVCAPFWLGTTAWAFGIGLWALHGIIIKPTQDAAKVARALTAYQKELSTVQPPPPRPNHDE